MTDDDVSSRKMFDRVQHPMDSLPRHRERLSQCSRKVGDNLPENLALPGFSLVMHYYGVLRKELHIYCLFHMFKDSSQV